MVTIHTRFPHQLANRIWDTCINQSGCCIKHRVLESISKILTFGNNTCDRHIAAIHQNNHWVFIPPKFIWGNAIIQSAFGNVHVDNVQMASILWMEEILHHLGWLKTYKQWDVNHLSIGDSDFATIHRMVSECITGFDPSAHVFLEILTHPTLQRGNAFHAAAARFGSQLDSSQLKHGSVETFVIFTKCGMAGICFFFGWYQ